jgi:hypothetical protein
VVTSQTDPAPAPGPSKPAKQPVERAATSVAPLADVAVSVQSEGKSSRQAVPVAVTTPVANEPAPTVAVDTVPPLTVGTGGTDVPTVAATPVTATVSATRDLAPESKPVHAPKPNSGVAAVSTTAPAPVLAAIPPEAGYASRSLMVAAFALLGVAAGLSLVLVRRRTPACASIITRSLDHEGH